MKTINYCICVFSFLAIFFPFILSAQNSTHVFNMHTSGGIPEPHGTGTNNANVTIGPISSTQAQFSTTASSHFLFNRDLRVSTGNIGSSSGNLSLRTGTATKMTVLSSNGFVGMGTTSPTSALHIHGNTPTTPPCSPGPCMQPTEGYLQITNAFSGAGQWDGLKLGLYDTEASIGTADMALLKIFNGNATMRLFQDGRVEFGSIGKFVVKSNGQVGIGTVSPVSGYMLDVAGKIRSCEVKVSQTSWCDFVFAPDYPLLSLSNLKEFINEHRHLPEMPSEAEVLENDGFEVSKMTQALLQRAEENTLYIIALEEKNAELQNKLTQQSEQLEAKIAALEKKLEEVLSK